MSTVSVTREDLGVKAAKIVADTYKSYPQLNGRSEAAAALIDSGRILRQGPSDESTVDYWVPSSADYEASLLAVKPLTGPPFHRVRLSYTGIGKGHDCTCDDYLWGYRTDGRSGAPKVNGQLVCKHVLAALALEQARDRLGLKAAEDAAAKEAQRVRYANRSLSAEEVALLNDAARADPDDDEATGRAWLAQFPREVLLGDGLPDPMAIRALYNRDKVRYGFLWDAICAAVNDPGSFYNEHRDASKQLVA